MGDKAQVINWFSFPGKLFYPGIVVDLTRWPLAGDRMHKRPSLHT